MAIAKLIVTLLLIALSTAAPTKLVDDKTTDLSSQALVIFEQLCKTQFCLFGKAIFTPETYSCECPDLQTHPLVS